MEWRRGDAVGIRMRAEVRFRDGRPHFAAGSRCASTILMVKRGRGRALEQQNFTACEIRCLTDPRRDTVPRWKLAVRGVAEVEAFRTVLSPKTHGISADHNGHGFKRLVIAKVAAFAGEDSGDVIFDG